MYQITKSWLDFKNVVPWRPSNATASNRFEAIVHFPVTDYEINQREKIKSNRENLIHQGTPTDHYGTFPSSMTSGLRLFVSLYQYISFSSEILLIYYHLSTDSIYKSSKNFVNRLYPLKQIFFYLPTRSTFGIIYFFRRHFLSIPRHFSIKFRYDFLIFFDRISFYFSCIFIHLSTSKWTHFENPWHPPPAPTSWGGFL